MSDDRLPIVRMIDDNVNEDDEADSHTQYGDPFGWYNSKPAAVDQNSAVINQRDCRVAGISTGCNAKMWQECTYGEKPKSSDNFCFYLTFGTMCYKVTDKAGKELN